LKNHGTAKFGQTDIRTEESKGLTQEELAEQCKISARTLQRIESGVVTPRFYTVRVIFAALKEDSSFMRLHFEHVYQYLKDLFNLKINTMKKVSILSTTVAATGFGLFALCSESNAQKTEYHTNGGRGIVYLIPRDLTMDVFISNVKDTALYKYGKYRIQEYKRNIFLNGEFVGYVDEGDTVILNKSTLFKKATITVKEWHNTMRSLNGKNIIYKFPKNFYLNYSRMLDEYEMYTFEEKFEIKEAGNRIYLNGVYQGEAFANDTVILRPQGTLIIKSANRD
jgi:transcriptional regulator with XRE-family HTH domain